jgi:hypothetical protein
MHNDSAAVTDHLNSAANRDQCCKRPLLPAVALVDMNKHADAEDGDEEGVGGKVWLILEDAPLNTACLEVALSPTSLIRSIGSHCLLLVLEVEIRFAVGSLSQMRSGRRLMDVVLLEDAAGKMIYTMTMGQDIL